MSPLSILFRDPCVLALDKPSGISVHRGLDATPDTVVARLAAMGLSEARPVHRLDRGTSGVIVCGLSAAAAAALTGAFADGETRKVYVALVRGVAPEDAEVDHPIPRDEGGPRVAARTRVTRVAVCDVAGSGLRETRYSLVRAMPETGRFHQVRRHLKHLGHPVVGDTTYGRSEHNRLCAERFGLRRLALHAERLSVRHPEGGGVIDLFAPLPSDLTAPLAAMGFGSV